MDISVTNKISLAAFAVLVSCKPEEPKVLDVYFQTLDLPAVAAWL